MKFKKESRFLHYLVLFQCLFFLNSVRCEDKGTITMVSVQVNTEEGGTGKFVHKCGGTLITNSVVFTGCSCITKPPPANAEDKDKLELLAPDLVRVSAGVSEASKVSEVRVQTAVAYALSVHDLCDATYAYNYGMIKLTTSFVLENGLELSHALSLDMSNFDKNIQSMGPTDCWAEIWTSPEGGVPPGPSKTLPPTSTTTEEVSTPEESDEGPEPDDYGPPSAGGGFNETTEPEYSSDSAGVSSVDMSGTEPSSGTSDFSVETTDITSADDGSATIDHSSSADDDHSSADTTENYDDQTVNITSEEIMPNKTITPVTIGPVVGKNESLNGTTLPPVIVPGGNNATGQNGSNTDDVHGPNVGPISNETANTNGTVEAPQGYLNKNSSMEGVAAGAANSSIAGGAVPNITENELPTGRSSAAEPLKTTLKPGVMGRRRRLANPPPQEVAPVVQSTNVTGNLANASHEGGNATGGALANASSPTNGTEMGPGSPSSNVSTVPDNVIPGSNVTGGGNDTRLVPPEGELKNTTTAGNNTTGSKVENGTNSNKGNETVPGVVSVGDGTHTNATVEGVDASASGSEESGTTEGSDENSLDPGLLGSGTTESGTEPEPELSEAPESTPSSGTTPDYEDGSSSSGSGDEEASPYSGNASIPQEEPTKTTVPGKPTTPTTVVTTPSTKLKEPPQSGSTPRSVGRMPVSILDWKECHDLVCPDPSKKCDSSFDETKWCLSAMQDGFRVCEADTGSPVYCKSALMGILSNVGLACPKTTAKGVAVGLDQAFEYIKSMMGMPDFKNKVPPAETKARKSGAPKKHNPTDIRTFIGFVLTLLLL